jgi:putative ABC transport system substrate-binding protein
MHTASGRDALGCRLTRSSFLNNPGILSNKPGPPLGIGPSLAWAQSSEVRIIGVLATTSGPDDPLLAAFRQGLRDLGHVEGKNIKLEFRTAAGQLDRLDSLARELVQMKADVLLSANPIAAQALKKTTSTIPIVVALFDPVVSGLVTNLARPGGNITGLSSMAVDLYSKRLQLLKEMVPGIKRVVVLWNTGALPVPLQIEFAEEIKAAAKALSVDLKFVAAEKPEEFQAAFSAIKQAQPQALYLHENAVFYVHRRVLASIAAEARLPTLYGSKVFVQAGGLVSYGVDYADQIRRSAWYVDRILKGAKPGDLPIEQPTKFELVVNSKTANALGLTIPEPVLLRADEVIR